MSRLIHHFFQNIVTQHLHRQSVIVIGKGQHDLMLSSSQTKVHQHWLHENCYDYSGLDIGEIFRKPKLLVANVTPKNFVAADLFLIFQSIDIRLQLFQMTNGNRFVPENEICRNRTCMIHRISLQAYISHARYTMTLPTKEVDDEGAQRAYSNVMTRPPSENSPNPKCGGAARI